VDQYLDNRHKEILWSLLANPADTGQLHVQNLERMVTDHPQSGVLQVMLARAGNQQQLTKAAAYINPRILHKLAHNPDDFQEVAAGKIVQSSLIDTIPQNYFSIGTATDEETDSFAEVENAPRGNEGTPVAENNTTEDTETIVTDETATAGYGYIPELIEEAPAGETEQEQLPVEELQEVAAGYGYIPEIAAETEPEEEAVADKMQQEVTGNNEYTYTPPATEDTTPEPEQYTAEEEENEQQVNNAITNTPAENNYNKEEEYFRQDIEDEIYDEIVSIEDIGFEALANEGRHPTFSAETDQVASDYSSFDQKLNELRNGDIPAEPAPAKPEAEQQAPVINEQQSATPYSESKNVSRYNDDKMPYSFMWWLDKTRKEHAGSFQPYTANKPAPAPAAQQSTNEEKAIEKPAPNTPADELQQQYYENIFSLTSISGIERDNEPLDVEFDHNKKEDLIIERFIHTEPQIKPLAADKLDNENKAKKSSEDQNELVTETLARIYTDQMLYHKAIATYKKLILNFPEKKLYFAAQIEQLEKKTN
jgi:hypothetical protein